MINHLSKELFHSMYSAHTLPYSRSSSAIREMRPTHQGMQRNRRQSETKKTKGVDNTAGDLESLELIGIRVEFLSHLTGKVLSDILTLLELFFFFSVWYDKKYIWSLSLIPGTGLLKPLEFRE